MKEVLPDGRVKYTYPGKTVYVTPKPGRRAYNRRPPEPAPPLIEEKFRVMPQTRPFKDPRRHYKGQRTVG